jgi:phosphohistidine phosphatase SixA
MSLSRNATLGACPDRSWEAPELVRRASGRTSMSCIGLVALLLAACDGALGQATTPTRPVAAGTAVTTVRSTVPRPAAAATPPPSATRPPTSPTATAAMAQPASPAAATPAAAASPSGELAGQALVDALRRGGYVIYFRHAATDRGGVDSVAWPREQQRNLSEAGRADAEAIGRAFRALGIPVGRVLASPFYRTMDTAQLAFGRFEVTPELLGLLSDDAGRAERAAAVRRLLGTPPEPWLNTVLVAHQSNLQDAAGVSLPEGGAAVVQPLGSGEFRPVARLTPADWTALAQSVATPAR